MKQAVICVMCIGGSAILCAASDSKILVNDLVEHWQRSKSLALAVAEAVPGGWLSFVQRLQYRMELRR
jgi:hypothetical protein